MGRLICVVTLLLAVLLPAAGSAGEINFRLPLAYWNMASCTSPGKETEAQCSWQVDNQGGVGIDCKLEAREANRLQEITVNIAIRLSGRNDASRPAGLQKFAYDYSGIGCWAYVPSGMTNLACRKRSNGFSCSWCTGYYCYEGHADLSHRIVHRSDGRTGLALAEPSGLLPSTD